MGLCTASIRGRNNGCAHPRVESAESSLCARHLMIAKNDVDQIGTPYLVSIIKNEESK